LNILDYISLQKFKSQVKYNRRVNNHLSHF